MSEVGGGGGRRERREEEKERERGRENGDSKNGYPGRLPRVSF